MSKICWFGTTSGGMGVQLQWHAIVVASGDVGTGYNISSSSTVCGGRRVAGPMIVIETAAVAALADWG